MASSPAAASTDGSQVSLLATSWRCGESRKRAGASASAGTRWRLQKNVHSASGADSRRARVRSTATVTMPTRGRQQAVRSTPSFTAKGLKIEGPPPKARDPQERREGKLKLRRSEALTAILPPTSEGQSRFVELLLARPRALSDDLRVAVEDLAQVGRRLQAALFHGLEKRQDVAHARQVDALLARQVLDHLQLADVALGVAPPVGRGAERLDQTHVFVEH